MSDSGSPIAGCVAGDRRAAGRRALERLRALLLRPPRMLFLAPFAMPPFFRPALLRDEAFFLEEPLLALLAPFLRFLAIAAPSGGTRAR